MCVDLVPSYSIYTSKQTKKEYESNKKIFFFLFISWEYGYNVKYFLFFFYIKKLRPSSVTIILLLFLSFLDMTFSCFIHSFSLSVYLALHRSCSLRLPVYLSLFLPISVFVFLHRNNKHYFIQQHTTTYLLFPFMVFISLILSFLLQLKKKKRKKTSK